MHFPGIGTLVNIIAVLLGGGGGLLLKKGIPERFQKIIFTAVGTGSFLIGLTGVLTASLTAAQDGEINSRWGLLLILSLVLGGIIGEALGIEAAFERFGAWLKKKTAGENSSAKVGEGFVAATIIFCVGSMAIIGAMEDAVGNPSILYTKALMDGITAAIFATAYGFGVLFSAVSVAVYQGLITALALWVMPQIPPMLVSQMSLCGSAIIMLIGFSLWEVKSFKVANLTPAMFMPLILWWIPFFR